MEHTAIRQLEDVPKLPGVVRAVGFPDLHTGKDPIGIAMETEGILYPHLIGNDIGCGMGLFETSCALKKFKQERLVIKLNRIRALENLPTENPYSGESPIYDLGTVGGGNHFAGSQTVYEVLDGGMFEQPGINENQLLLLIHSDSRGYGQRILDESSGLGGLSANSERAQACLAKHDSASLWAERDRHLVAEKLMGYVGYSQEVKPLLDCCHNFAERRDDHLIYRKRAISALKGPVIIPDSQDSLMYLVLPAADTSLSGHSLSHRAGRKWARSLCKSRIKDKYERDTTRHSKLSSHTVCHGIELLYRGALEVYKNIKQVAVTLAEHGLCTAIATLYPLVTYKGQGGRQNEIVAQFRTRPERIRTDSEQISAQPGDGVPGYSGIGETPRRAPGSLPLSAAREQDRSLLFREVGTVDLPKSLPKKP